MPNPCHKGFHAPGRISVATAHPGSVESRPHHAVGNSSLHSGSRYTSGFSHGRGSPSMGHAGHGFRTASVSHGGGFHGGFGGGFGGSRRGGFRRR